MFLSIHDFTFFYDRHRNLRTSLRKKETFACAIFKICCVACAISRAGKLICQYACLHEHDRAGLLDMSVNSLKF